MFALDRCKRTIIAASALAAFAGSFVTAPFAARGQSSADPLHRPLAGPPAAATPGTVALVIPNRDPFAGEPPPVPHAAAPASSSAVALPPIPAIPGAIRPLPPNAGAAGQVLPFAPPTRVTAVVTGAQPYALVDEAGRTRVVTTGDTIDGDTIAAIGPTGIRLAHGTTLSITPRSSPAEPFPGERQP